MKRIIVFLLLSVSALMGQTPRPGVAGERDVTKVITLKYPDSVSTAILDGWGLTVKRNNGIVVVIGSQDKVDTAETILKQLDVPPAPRTPGSPLKSVELTAYLIIAASTSAQGSPVPKELESPVRQVASMFSYKSFILLDSIVMRIKEGGGGSDASVSGVLPNGTMPVDSFFPRGSLYSLDVRGMMVSRQTPEPLIQLGYLNLKLSIRNGTDKDGKDKYQDVGMRTNVDIKEGQKVVVGKANIDGSSNALIVILTAKIIE